MTQKQEEVKSQFLKLIEKGSKRLRINFINSDQRNDARANEPRISKSYRQYDNVIIELIDPQLDEWRLSEWLVAIDQAKRLLELIEEERLYESLGPNFFVAMRVIGSDYI